MENHIEHEENHFKKVEIVTVEYLESFRKRLLSEIKELLDERLGSPKLTKEWLTKFEAMTLLNIKSDSTLSTLRKNGTVPFTKLGGKILYNKEALEKLLGKLSHNQ